MKKKEPNVLSTLYQKPAPINEIIEGSKQIGYQAYQRGKEKGQDLLSEAASYIDPFGISKGGSRWINQRGPDGETVLGVDNKPISTREHNLLSQAAFKQSQRAEKIDLSDEELLTQELQRLTALSNNAKNDNFANMWTEAAIYLQNKKAQINEAGEGTQFNLINKLQEEEKLEEENKSTNTSSFNEALTGSENLDIPNKIEGTELTEQATARDERIARRNARVKAKKLEGFPAKRFHANVENKPRTDIEDLFHKARKG